jgi:hypothetical protein
MFHFGEHLLNPPLIWFGPAGLCRRLESRDIMARGLRTILLGRHFGGSLVGASPSCLHDGCEESTPIRGNKLLALNS